MSERRRELLRALTSVQNEPINTHRDILTITGFMDSDDEVALHVLREQKRFAEMSAHAGVEGGV